MSLGASARPAPSTPSPKKQVQGIARVDSIIQDLNSNYNLGIEICDKSLTPSHRRERARIDSQFARFDQISRILQQLVFRGGEPFVDRALKAFHRESKGACRNWIYKPKADCDILPTSHLPCKASTPGEQNELQEILIGILEQLRERLRPEPVALPSVQDAAGARDDSTDGFALPSRPSQQARPKRPSNDGLERSSKRVKEADIGYVATVIDKVPARKKVGRDDPVPSGGNFQSNGRTLGRSLCDASANTSKASLVPSIFSNNDFEPLPASQSTVDPATDEPKKSFSLPGHPQSSTADSFAPSSGDIRALDESFSHYVERGGEFPLSDQATRRIANSPQHGTEYSDISGLPDARTEDISAPGQGQAHPLEARLMNIWPRPPRWHRKAPLAVLWEFTRICLHCGVDSAEVDIQYDPAWSNEKSYRSLWAGLLRHPALSSKAFPEPPDDSAWAAATKLFSAQNIAVILSASLDFNPSKVGPLFLLRLNPLRLDKGCRLNRRFGADRFLEVLIPSTTSKASSSVLKDDASVQRLIHWLSRERHSVFGRQWAAFFTADAGYRKPIKEVRTSPDVKPVFKERIHLFAEHGHDFKASVCPNTLGVNSVEEMLDWLLQFKANQDQPFLKLFSRIQLGLSKTDPVIELEERQILHRPRDLLSPTGKVMNDGIGRVSLSIARRVQADLGLSDLPSAIQGRMGSAKGMWIVDVHDGGTGTEDWIETYPSQRKWRCAQSDRFHRTLEVHAVSHELRSASLNLQFLPVLEDRALDRRKMRDTIGDLMADDLRKELDSLKSSMTRPVQFRDWVHRKGSSVRAERVQHQQVVFVGGLPKKNEEIMNFLLDGGFNPREQKFLQELAFTMQKQKCDILKWKLNIRVGRSAYMYMVVDFWGVLEEDEVHVGFSSKFQEPQGQFSDVLLHGMDVLVARSPAHLPSDIQKVKAVFKTELRALKDVIVFPSKGNTPLADKLSGGDYDGDKAWVCWDPSIVGNFVNADVPEPPDLSPFLGKDKTTFGDLVRRGRQQDSGMSDAIGEMIERSFQFNMGQSLLGQCTNYKEKLCYRTHTVRDHASVVLSTLLGNLVDQPKQGIVFTTDAWDRLRRHLKVPFHLDDPAYKFDNWTARAEPTHVIDHLKFSVVKKSIDAGLGDFYHNLNAPGVPAQNYDEDLVKPFDHFRKIADSSASCQKLLLGLEKSLGEVYAVWGEVMGKDRDKDGNESTFEQRTKRVHAQWHDIRPQFAGRPAGSQPHSKVVSLLLQDWLSSGVDGDDAVHPLSCWSLIKASLTFKLYHARRVRFVWHIAGRQLQYIKAMASSSKSPGGVPTLVEALLYAGYISDKKFVVQYVAMMEGQNSEFLEGLDDEDEDEGNDA